MAIAYPTDTCDPAHELSSVYIHTSSPCIDIRAGATYVAPAKSGVFCSRGAP